MCLALWGRGGAQEWTMRGPRQWEGPQVGRGEHGASCTRGQQAWGREPEWWHQVAEVAQERVFTLP